MVAERPRRGNDEGAGIGREAITSVEPDALFLVERDRYGCPVGLTENVMPSEPTAAENRDRGLRRAGRGRDETVNDLWRRQARPAVERLAARGTRFTAEDVRREGADEPVSANAWGALFSTMAKAGVIEQVGWTTGTRPSSHGRGIRVWQGRVIRG